MGRRQASHLRLVILKPPQTCNLEVQTCYLEVQRGCGNWTDLLHRGISPCGLVPAWMRLLSTDGTFSCVTLLEAACPSLQSHKGQLIIALED